MSFLYIRRDLTNRLLYHLLSSCILLHQVHLWFHCILARPWRIVRCSKDLFWVVRKSLEHLSCKKRKLQAVEHPPHQVRKGRHIGPKYRNKRKSYALRIHPRRKLRWFLLRTNAHRYPQPDSNWGPLRTSPPSRRLYLQNEGIWSLRSTQILACSKSASWSANPEARN